MPTHKDFTIHIDNKVYKVNEETITGAQLRSLAQPSIGAERDLYEEVPGSGDDLKIEDSDSVNLKNGMHFYSTPTTINPGNK